MSTDLATTETKPEQAVQSRPQRIEVMDPVPVLDTGRFEHMQRIATAMAQSSLIPDSLRKEGSGDKERWLDHHEVVANCFLVVNQAVRWGLDPFAVSSCVSVVHGKLCYEGKLIAAVLEAKLGVHLDYEWNDQRGDAMGIRVTGVLPDGQVKTVEGTVGEWKTSGSNSPWGKMARKMLAYRGAREWARLWAPGIMLGVYSDDEMESLSENTRARLAQPVGTGLASRLQGAQGGFNAQTIESTLEEAQGRQEGDSGTQEPEDDKTPSATAAADPGAVADEKPDPEVERDAAGAALAGASREPPEGLSEIQTQVWFQTFDKVTAEVEAV